MHFSLKQTTETACLSLREYYVLWLIILQLQIHVILLEYKMQYKHVIIINTQHTTATTWYTVSKTMGHAYYTS